MLNIEKLRKQKADLQKSYTEARKASIEMDSKMQSRYDTQKEDWARRAEIIDHLIAETQRKIDYLENLSIPSQNDLIEIGHVVTIQQNDEVFSLLLVDGVPGGIKLDNVQLVSVDAPIGRTILGHKRGDRLFVSAGDEKIELSVLSINVVL